MDDKMTARFKAPAGRGMSDSFRNDKARYSSHMTMGLARFALLFFVGILGFYAVLVVTTYLGHPVFDITLSRADYFLILTGLSLALFGTGLAFYLMSYNRKVACLSGRAQQAQNLVQNYEKHLDSAGSGVAFIDAAGRIFYANDYLARLYGYDKPTDLYDRIYRELVSPAQRQDWDFRIYPALQDAGQWHGSQKILKADGDILIQDVIITKTGDETFVLIAGEYTEFMEVLNLSNKRLAAIEAAGDGIGIINADGHLTYMNEALMTLHGISRDESYQFLNASWLKLYSPKGRKHIHSVVMPALEKTGYWRGETPLLKQDGTVTHAEMSLARLPDGGLIGTARDISERKDAEEEKDILQRQIFQAQKMESIGRLAGGIAHDFNNLLASMMGYTEFLLEDLTPESKQHHFARQIMAGGIQARQLIEQILTFSRRSETVFSDIDLGGTIRDIVVMLKATLPATVSLDTQIDLDNLAVEGNPTQISQVLMNLCVNATDAMDGETGVLKITAQQVEAENTDFRMAENDLPSENYAPEITIVENSEYGGENRSPYTGHTLYLGYLAKDHTYAAITVEDTGTGMDYDVLEKIFEPFFTTKDINKGTGLGLSTIMGMLAAHRGALKLVTAPGEGAAFTLYYPVSQTSTAIDKSDTYKPLDVSGLGTILLVEDEKSVRGMLQEMLIRLGYDLHMVSSGKEALNILQDHEGQVDLVLSDYMMPDMSGLELTRTLAEHYPSLPVVLISGYNPDILYKARDTIPTVRAVLKKPVDSFALAQALKSAFAPRAA